MKTTTLKPTLNPAFKATQPLPLLPADFVAKRAWAARPFSAPGRPAETFRLDVATTHRCTIPLQHEIIPQSGGLVA